MQRFARANCQAENCCMKRLLGLAFITVFVFACNKQSVEGELIECFPESITLELNKCVEKTTESKKPQICFVQLKEDSRCPLNVNCVWAGNAVAKFTLNDGSTLHEVTLSTAKYPGYPSTDTTVEGYRVKLVTVTPYPGSQTQESTQAVLQITR